MEKTKINRLLTLSLTTAITLAASAAIAEPQEGISFGSQIIDAADHNDFSTVQNLLSSGSNPNERGEFGTTSLLRAVYNNNPQLVSLLLSSGASTDMKDIGGATATLIAAREGHNQVLQMLIQHGADVNLRDNEGFTPLMRASMAGNQMAVQALLNSGAKVNMANSFGETAFSQAKADNKSEIVGMLASHGANDTLAEKPAKSLLAQVSHRRSVEVANAGSGADINVDFSKGALHEKLVAAKPQPAPVHVLAIDDPKYSIGSYYVPNKNTAPVVKKQEAQEAQEDRLDIPAKPTLSQTQSVKIDQKWLSNIGKLAATAVRPYQLASNEMIVPGTQNNILDLGAFKSQEFANKKLEKIKKNFPQIFASVPLKIVQQGTASHIYYQIHAGVIGSDQEAGDICKKLVTSGINCRAVSTSFKNQAEFNSFAGDVPAPLPAKLPTTTTASLTPLDKQDVLGAAPSPKVEGRVLITPRATPPATNSSTASNIGSFARPDYDSMAPAANNPSPIPPPPPPAPQSQAEQDLNKEETILEAKPASAVPVTLRTIVPVDDAPPPPPPPPAATAPAGAPLKSIVPVGTNNPPPPPPPAPPMAALPAHPVAAAPAAPAVPTAPVVVKPPAPVMEAAPAPMMPDVTPIVEAKPAVVAPVEKAAEKEEVAPQPVVKKKPKPRRKYKIPTPGQGVPPKDLTTGQPLSMDSGDGKFDVARPVKSAALDIAPAWVKIDFFPSPAAAHGFLNTFRTQNPIMANYRTRVSAPLTMPEKTTAQVGPFTSQSDLQSFCSAITQSGMNCSAVPSASAAPAQKLVENLPAINQLSPAAGDAPGYTENGQWLIQLGSYDSHEAAQNVWNDYASENKNLKKVQNSIVAADDGRYRLRAGSFPSSSKADSFCDDLRAKSISCIIIKN